MLTSKQVQDLIGVPDHTIIAYGYTYNRTTVDIWFENNHLCRRDYSGYNRFQEVEIRTEIFDPTYFTRDIKRWYIGDVNSGKCLNQKLLELFETFGGHLSMTAGGTY